MILNDLGFIERRFYPLSDLFDSIPVEHFLSEGIIYVHPHDIFQPSLRTAEPGTRIYKYRSPLSRPDQSQQVTST